MNENDSKDITFVYSNNDLSYYNIRFAFNKLLGPLATASEYKEFGNKREEYSDILKIVAKWSCEYEDKKTLIYIDYKEILSVYYKVEELNDDLLANSKSEISDEIVIWLWEIMVLRKKQIDNYNNGK